VDIEGVELSAADLAVLRDQPEPAPAAPEPAPAAPADPAPAEPTPQPRTEDGKFDTPAGEPDKKLVPLPELQRERERRKELQERFEAAERQRIADNAKLQERLDMLQRGLQPPQPAQEEGPMQRLARVEREQEAERQQRQAVSQQQQLAFAYQQKADEFERDTPDFRAAYQHLMTVRTNEMRAAGIAEHEIPGRLMQSELQMAANSLREGVNPASRLYSIAKALGYSGAPAPAPAPAAAPAPAPAAAAAAASDEAGRLATIRAGQAASASLATAGGSPPPDLTLESLLSMDEDDFTKLATNPKAWRKAMGG
jgi:hypothetical protein